VYLILTYAISCLSIQSEEIVDGKCTAYKVSFNTLMDAMCKYIYTLFTNISKVDVNIIYTTSKKFFLKSYYETLKNVILPTDLIF